MKTYVVDYKIVIEEEAYIEANNKKEVMKKFKDLAGTWATKDIKIKEVKQ